MLSPKQFVRIVAVAGLSAYAAIYASGLAEAPVRSDGYSYYVYLPAWFIHHDPSLQAVADDCCGGVFPAFTGIVRWPGTGRWVNPHPIGVALMMLPLFAVAHLLTWWSNLPPDGFSLFYQHAAGLSGVVALVAGLSFLRSFLQRWFSDRVTLATLATLVFGTNLFHYGTYDSTFSHVYSFALIAALLDLTDRWWRDPAWTTSAALAVVSALIVLTRHPNAIYLLITPLWRPAELWARRARLFAVAALALVCVTPQLAVYYRAAGQPAISVYGQLGRFDFGHPRVASVLFGTSKGLFFWSPVLAAAVAGLFDAHPLVRRLRAAAAIGFAATTYLIASWSDWQFGGSFGHRGFTDGLAVAAVFIAAFYAAIAGRPRMRRAIAVAVAVMCVVSSLQMVQYWKGLLPIADTTWGQYKERFLRFR